MDPRAQRRARKKLRSVAARLIAATAEECETLGIELDQDLDDDADDDAEDEDEDFFAGGRAPAADREPLDVYVLACNLDAVRVHGYCAPQVSAMGAYLGVHATEIEAAVRLAGLVDVDLPALASGVKLMASVQAQILNLRQRRAADQQRARRR